MNFLDVFFRDFDKDMSDAFHTLNTRIGKPVDIYTTENALVLEIAVVGRDKDDIHIKTEKDMVRVSTTSKDEVKKDHVYRGISRSDFDLGWRISSSYDVSKLEASLDKGLLKITIPAKTEEEQGIKEVEIK